MSGYLKEFFKQVVFRHTSLGAPRYQYNIEPIQIAEIINGIERSKANSGGCVVEIGLARGLTSKLIAEHIKRQSYDTMFYCLDTFSSFTKADLEFEYQTRGKTRGELVGFSYNDFEVWKSNFVQYPFVQPIQTDVSEFDFSTIAPINFCFLDVDLYVPTKKALENMLPHMAPGGVIAVDDVLDNNRWDGAFQAFMEFVSENRLLHRVSGNKCGVIEL
ncbi:hypothetical protein BN1012_Phect866 [Candidatus Phaeomarinobacter ectocarpi]|uniref:Methyltransferase n=1 Tax=Candidatus Phaeomarinibacter ectocarpi TaxID=1458461 RepID=X5ML18_9HYPH|nr:class I SAM-dependent methyltransferase [Candidatus Phaeomarinobacter ectocarpi]CDO59080.1 hypothetical protein BN1012_Phect866 [Candidatus Phaeomarinobacter ectocarpi]